MKKYIIIASIAISTMLSSMFVSANYEDFLDQLTIMDITVDELLQEPAISRYELARLLNAVECEDCLHAPQRMVDRYTNPFWNNFIQLPGKDFDDIMYEGGIYDDNMYYYCVAYVGDNEYMRGYPEATSPICGSFFCGARNTTKAEFLQVVINLIAKYVYQDYSVNRDDVQRRMISLMQNSYADRNLDTNDRQTIDQQAANCNDTLCPVRSSQGLKTYLKYCMFNIDACAMREFGDIQQGYWPVAELNLLYDQDILPLAEALATDIHDPVSGEEATRILYELYDVVQCDFDTDYDCDGISNAQDNCPNTYNAQQTDTDNDNKGDVCDRDIDNDGMTNPLHIVDDNGRIIIGNATNDMDNCLFVPNQDQIDKNNNNLGDVCELQRDKLGMYINTSALDGSTPLNVTFDAITRGTVVGDIHWSFGDGTNAVGNTVSHTYTQPGIYHITATASGRNNNAYAKTTVIVGENTSDYYGLHIRPSRAGGPTPTTVTFVPITRGDIDTIDWIVSDGTTTTTTQNAGFTKLFTDTGRYVVTAKAYANNQLVSVANTTIGIDQPAAHIQTATIQPQIDQTITTQTTLHDMTANDIQSIERYRGDGQAETNTNLIMAHRYNQGGSYVIIQTITLTNEQTITNYLTIHVIDPKLTTSHGLIMAPDSLRINRGTPTDFTITTLGDSIDPLISIQQFTNNMTERTNVLESSFTHSYDTPGIYHPRHTIHLNQCNFLETEATIVVNGVDQCLQYVGMTGDILACDLDDDGIPDTCDNDIDGDGVENLVGIVLYDNPDCSFDSNNIDQSLLEKHYQGVCSLDNCPLSSNSNQRDLNRNGIGDACADNTLRDNDIDTQIIDSDADGTPDSIDACPSIPENYNGIDDIDGCPEIGTELACGTRGLPGIGPDIGPAAPKPPADCTDPVTCINPPNVSVTQCNQCPCQFADFASDLVKNDIVRALLWTKEQDLLYSESLPATVDE